MFERQGQHAGFPGAKPPFRDYGRNGRYRLGKQPIRFLDGPGGNVLHSPPPDLPGHRRRYPDFLDKDPQQIQMASAGKKD